MTLMRYEKMKIKVVKLMIKKIGDILYTDEKIKQRCNKWI